MSSLHPNERHRRELKLQRELGPRLVALMRDPEVPEVRVDPDGRVFVDHARNISSAVGSVSMTFGGQNFYRASKAGLNMSMCTIAKALRRSKEPGYNEIIVGQIHLGVVATDFAKKVPIPMISPEESAAAVIKVIDG